MLQDSIRDLIEPLIESELMELVDIECQKMKTRWLIRLFIDKEGGVTLDDCQKISHVAGDILDVHNVPHGPYTLEVSSPGLNRRLTRDKDFLKFRGENVQIRTAEKIEGIRNFQGRLVEYIIEDGGKTVVVEREGTLFRIPREQILKANLEVETEHIPRSPAQGNRRNKKKDMKLA